MALGRTRLSASHAIAFRQLSRMFAIRSGGSLSQYARPQYGGVNP
jgi:hypothetical protein